MEKIQAAKCLRRTGKFIGGGGFEAIIVQENKRPNLVREEFSLQGMTGINAYDGKTGWKIDPFQGKKDPESLSEDEMHGILLDAAFDEPLINYRQKGNKVELVGTDQIEGTDVYKLKVSLSNGDVRHYYMDTDSYVPIRMEERRLIRGSEQEFETTLGDYKEVNGWFMPFSIESARREGTRARQHLRKDGGDRPPRARWLGEAWASPRRPPPRRETKGRARRTKGGAVFDAVVASPPAGDAAVRRQGRFRDDLRPRRAQHRLGGDERPHRGARRRARGQSSHRLRRRGERRRVEIDERRHDLQAGLRQAGGAVDRRGDDRPDESEDRLGGHRRGVDAQQRVRRRRRLQVHRRRRELDQRGPQGVRAHREDPRRSDGAEHGLRLRARQALERQRRARRVQDHRTAARAGRRS